LDGKGPVGETCGSSVSAAVTDDSGRGPEISDECSFKNYFWNCLCRLAVEVRQFAKKLFRFFVIFVTEEGIFGSPGDTEGGSASRWIRKSHFADV
jgi:hypothetical protein